MGSFMLQAILPVGYTSHRISVVASKIEPHEAFRLAQINLDKLIEETNQLRKKQKKPYATRPQYIKFVLMHMGSAAKGELYKAAAFKVHLDYVKAKGIEITEGPHVLRHPGLRCPETRIWLSENLKKPN